MTMKPKARKFRIRRSAAPSAQLSRAAGDQAEPSFYENPDLGGEHEDGFGDAPFPTASQNDAITAPDEVVAENELAEIRREGLTGRQLRMARRVAQKHGLAPTSDFDAVRLLRRQGIDPFARSNMLELVVPGKSDVPADTEEPKLPKTTTAPKPQLPSTEVWTEDKRAGEIVKMQRDIVRRRRRKLAQLFARLAFFVGLPTLLAGYYYFDIATPMYATKSEFVIQQAESPAASAAGLSGIFSGTSFATSQDTITVQGYLQSRDAMIRLDEDLGFRAHFSDPSIDPLQRLEANSTMEEAYKVYKKRVKISYDPTEGVIKMEVSAADPESSAQFSSKLIGYAEEQVDNLTDRLRADQMAGALDSFKNSEANMIAAQQRVLELQERLGVLDPMVESNALMGQISTFETQLQEKKLQLQQLLDNSRPNQARVDGTRGDIRRLETLIAELRSQMTESDRDQASLARISGELRMAETDLQTRQMLMTQALQQMETARIEANRQTRYLSLGVNPIPPDEATYPRAFENTVLAFLIFAGIYLMASLTASILREQVSS